MQRVTLLDKIFEISISEEKIQERVSALAQQINKDYEGREVLFLCILNGAFMFAADLLKQIELKCCVSFLKIGSYEGTTSTGVVKQLIGLNESVKDKHLVVVEDVVDSGNTIEQIFATLNSYAPASIRVATAVFKPDVYKKEFPIDYVGLQVAPDFIVGYGLDYDGYGRNLRCIYTLVNE